MHLLPLLSLRGIGCLVCLVLALSPLGAATTTSTVPRGVITTILPVGNSALALPLIANDLFTGVVTANTSSTVDFGAGNVLSGLSAGGKYYLEVETGTMEGERFDLDTGGSLGAGGTTLLLDLSATSASTTNSLTASALVGARCVVRPHVTLGALTNLFNRPLTGNNNVAVADGAQLLIGGAFHIYYLRGDGVTWRESGKAVDETAHVIPPDTSLIMTLRSGSRSLDHVGLVRSNDFRINLTAGLRSFASGFPIDLTPVQVSAFTDTALPANLRWVGNNNPASADSFQIFDASVGTFVTYYLRGDGVAWRRAGGATDLQNSPLIAATTMIVVNRTNPDAGYLILSPLTP